MNREGPDEKTEKEGKKIKGLFDWKHHQSC